MLAQRDARSLASEDNGYVDPAGDGHNGRAGLVRRLAAVPHAPAVAGALLAVLAAAQAIALPPGQGGIDFGQGVGLVLLALFSTLPLGLLWSYPAGAAVAVGAACVLSLAAFHTVTVAGLIAQLIVLYRLGRSGPQLLAAVLALPYLVLALLPPRAPRTGSSPCCWLRWPRPRRGRGRPGEPASRLRNTAPSGRSSPVPCSSTRYGGNAPGSPASCTTWWPTTFP